MSDEPDIKRVRDEAISATFHLMINQLMSRRGMLAQTSLDPRRNIDRECGYPENPSPDEFAKLYERSDIAARVVEVWPKETWQVSPEIKESEDVDTTTPFEDAWRDISQQLRGEFSFFQDEKGAVVWEYLQRLDVVSGINKYGVLLYGIDDGQSLNTPATFYVGNDPASGGVRPKPKAEDVSPETNARRTTAPRKLLYLRCFPEHLAKINTWVTDKTNPRYGQPESYELTFSSTGAEANTNEAEPTQTEVVHWSRVLHLAKNIITSEVFGMEEMRQPLNRILDHGKILGSSGEMYYQGAFPGFAFETHPGLSAKDLPSTQDLKDMYEEYRNGLQRAMAAAGITIKSLAPQVVDPSPQIDKNIEAICILKTVPVRIFKGSERGELASGQDDDKWNDRIKQRQDFFVTPRIVAPFIDRLIALGVLPIPTGYSVTWPDISSQTQLEKADIAVKQTTAMATYLNSGGESAITITDFFVYFLGFEDKVAKQLAENVTKFLESSDEEPTTSALLSLVGGITGVIELFKLASTGGISEEQLKQLIMLFYKVDEKKATEIIADGIPEPPAPIVNPNAPPNGQGGQQRGRFPQPSNNQGE